MVKHSTSLRFQNGTYASIFGIIPKEYKLESDETREIIQRIENPERFSLEMAASATRRILSLPDETPTVETGSKPLTGKVVNIVKTEGKWGFEILGVTTPDEAEKREANRLMARYVPGSSPFLNLSWSEDGKAMLDVATVLEFLGYTRVNVLLGSATATRSTAEDSSISLSFQADFEAGEGQAKVVAELKAEGKLSGKLEPDADLSVALDGSLAIHGQRQLEDGRVVPYSLITEFVYRSTSETVTSP